MLVREGTERDLPVLLTLFDGAVRWLTARGREAQWGSVPWSERPEAVDRLRGIATAGGLLIAETGGTPTGALSTREVPPEYVEPVEERELYVHLLITDRESAPRGLGRALLDHAVGQARDRGIDLVRVDCWAGGGGALVDYYRSTGFTPSHRFERNGWPGQVLTRRVSDEPAVTAPVGRGTADRAVP
ncbi:N-acetyltransferase [Actinoalloteichus sp. AHMU CJ021]|uniref:Acetyltransferase (GNAT) family protein n=1 Tax=Actinoalloteichus caeruleus DSM 43889 TaxID=1120930 RepID=A0ABT1JBA9_ACTCY|nr:GNAT family N-acetyltransferase [Actinoalloteichus caeruleus]AUS80450.1 N-acetyltransferase [Actinoalloteichus sp. AHMU CJ021]MCP2329790.1 Acetyltransferase (GNAT) family protein [Actinoalloteichus caeruleus DSM 43889]